MTRLGDAAYLDHIRTASARFADVLATCAPDARVPSCPDWDAADLLDHLTGVQDFWTHVVTRAPAPPAEDYEHPARPTSYADQLALFRTTHAAFAAALEAADPQAPAWSWSPRADDQRVGFSLRRQAHEALIHRLDAEQAAGAVTPLPADLAADGVHEVLDLIYGTLPEWGTFTPRPGHVEYRLTDAATSIWTQVGTFSGTSPEGRVYDAAPDQHVVDAPGLEASLVVRGTAADLDAWLWHRGGADRVEISGDGELRAALEALLDGAVG